MCGICGIIGIESKDTSEPILHRMMAAIIHRGPDEEGTLFAPPVALGSRRLSIIDLPGGSQPIWNEAGTLAVVFNGEIYNFRELRRELEACGHHFRTRSDTEVIVHAYEAWGESCAERLHGMFAFAIAEMPQGLAAPPARVFIARDRLGIKPLYYVYAGGALLFASEVRALLASGRVPARLSAAALPSYLLFGSVGEPSTLVDGVSSLPPGYCMTIATGGPIGFPEPRPYWNFAHIARQGASARSPAQDTADPSARQVHSLLESAVGSHLVSDVPLGVFLSSGLDSTVIAALASRALSGVHTFTVAFPDAEFSEAEQARRTAERFGTVHSELVISDREMLARLEEAMCAFDQPSMDGINTFFVSWAARQAGLKVALSGLGSDELFGGYPSFRTTSHIARLSAWARFLPKPIRALLALPFERLRSIQSSPDASRKALAAWLDPGSLPHPYFFTRALFTPRNAASHFPDASSAWTSHPWWHWLSDSAREAQSSDRFTAVSWLELRSYLVSTLLRDTDTMSMRHSLEVRVPFLDSSLVEYVLSLPESAKRGSRGPKSLLTEAMGDLLPPEIVAKPKRTFTFPWAKWLRGALAPRVAAGLADWSPALASQLDGAFALAVWKDFLDGRTTWSRPWSLYVLNEWAKRNLRADGVAGAGRPGDAAAVSAA